MPQRRRRRLVITVGYNGGEGGELMLLEDYSVLTSLIMTGTVASVVCLLIGAWLRFGH